MKTYCLILLMGFAVCIKAQDTSHKPRLFIETDILKLSSNLLPHDFRNNAEAQLSGLFGNIGFYVAVGHSERYQAKTPQYKNLYDYESKGNYFSAGLALMSNEQKKVRIRFNIGAVVSNFSEKGTFVVKGDYWNDRLEFPMAYNNVTETGLFSELGIQINPFEKCKNLGFYLGMGSVVGSYGKSSAYAENDEFYDYKPVYIPGMLDRNSMGPFKFRINLTYQIL